MSCRHDLALGTCRLCYPATGTITPTAGFGTSMDGPGAVPASACMRIPIAFIAGPFRGKTDWDRAENVRHAERYGLEVAKLGAMPIIPQANTSLFFGQLSEEEFWLPGYHRLCEVSDCLVLIPRWRNSSGAVGERSKFDEQGRGNNIFYLDNPRGAQESSDYERLRAWIKAFSQHA